MEKMSQQLSKNIEDRDAALLCTLPLLQILNHRSLTRSIAAVVDAQQRAKSHLERLESIQEELRKREAEVCSPHAICIKNKAKPRSFLSSTTVKPYFRLFDDTGQSIEEEPIVIAARRAQETGREVAVDGFRETPGDS